MGDTRRKNWNWGTGEKATWDGAQLAVLMDIRDELQHLNATLDCYRFRRLPDDIRNIDRRLMFRGLFLKKRRKK